MFNQLLRNIFSRIVFAFLAGLLFALLLEVIFSIQYRNYSMFGNLGMLVWPVILTYLFTEVAFRINKWLDKRVRWGQRPVRRITVQTGLHILLAFMLVTVLRLLFLVIFGSSLVILSDEITLLLFAVVVVILLNMLDFGAMLLNQWRISLAEAEKYRKESAEFEYEMLRAQVNPHFLFNSLNTLSSLVYEDRDRAAEFIRKLSDVYRYVLENRRKDLTTLNDEMDFTNSFIYLLKLRFGQKLQVEVMIDDSMRERKIPPLTLQLLIENAVKHNIISEKKPLSIKIYTNDQSLLVENRLQKKPQPGSTTGMGLQNIRNRYRMLTNRDVRVLEGEDLFKVEIPLI